MPVLTLYNLKGGVGKTTSAVNLAYLAARDGYRTLLWDLDPQGAASYYLRIRPRLERPVGQLLRTPSDPAPFLRETDFPNLDLLPADFSYRHMDLLLGGDDAPERRLADVLRPLRTSHDLFVLDAPPGFSLVSESLLGATDVLLVPLLPTPLSLRTYAQLRAFLTYDPFPGLVVRAFFGMVDRRKRLHREIVAALTNWPDILRPAIPYASTVERMGLERAPLPHFAPSAPATRAYRQLWQAVRPLLHPS